MRAEDQFHVGIVVDDLDSAPRIELISRSVQAGLEQYWATAPSGG